MGDKKSKSKGRKQHAQAEGYFARTKQLSLSLLYILPLLVIYEVGIILLDPTYENGAGTLLKLAFVVLGGSGGATIFNAFLIVCVCVAFIKTHHAGGTKPLYLVGVFIEATVWTVMMTIFAVLFIMILTGKINLHLETQAPAADVATFSQHDDPNASDAAAPASTDASDASRTLPAADADTAADNNPPEPATAHQSEPLITLDEDASRIAHGIVKSCGAGVYEEILFRLFLLTFLVWLISKVMSRSGDEGDQKMAVLAGVLFSSVLFAAAHHIPPQPPMEVVPMVFRTVCGFVFGMVYLFRGLAVAVYTHTIYDIYVFVIQPMLLDSAPE